MRLTEVFSLILWFIAGILACVWFSWKLLIVLLLFFWSNNLDNDEKYRNRNKYVKYG